MRSRYSVYVLVQELSLLVHRTVLDRHETRFAAQILRDQIGQYVHPVHRHAATSP